MKNLLETGIVADIYNDRTGELVVESARICDRWWQKAIGLMFAKNPFDLVMRFDRPQIVTLHMFLVFFPIDVLWLDGSGKVVELKERFFPFHVYTPKHFATMIIELRMGTIERSGTKVGDRLRIREKQIALHQDVKN